MAYHHLNLTSRFFEYLSLLYLVIVLFLAGLSTHQQHSYNQNNFDLNDSVSNFLHGDLQCWNYKLISRNNAAITTQSQIAECQKKPNHAVVYSGFEYQDFLGRTIFFLSGLFMLAFPLIIIYQISALAINKLWQKRLSIFPLTALGTVMIVFSMAIYLLYELAKTMSV